MAKFTYPAKDIDKPDTLLSYLGSHWGSAWSNTHQVRSLMLSRGREEYQKTLDLLEAEKSVSRLTVPTHQARHWQPIVLKESDTNTVSATLLKYGEEGRYGRNTETGVEFKYGVPKLFQAGFSASFNLRKMPFIFNRITQPSLSLVHGLDYFLDTSDPAIVFRKNPFNNPLVPVRDVYKDGEVVDREAVLWLFRAELEIDNVYTQFGHVLNISLPSSEEYRDYINAIWDAAVEGSGGKQIEEAIAALTDTPVVKTDGEIVEHVIEDRNHQLVLTDKHVYRYPQNVSAIVSVGDKVNAGDQLVDTVRIFEFHSGEVPSAIDLAAVELGEGLVLPGLTGGITFFNKDTPLTVDTSGIFTRVEWSVGGFAGDVAEFWDLFHARGIENPPTLAQLMDQRANKVGEPTAAALPATINPLKFLLENVLRNNAYVVKVRTNQQGPNRIPMSQANQLRKITPPHTAMIFLMELAVDDEFIKMDSGGDELIAGYTESPLLGEAAEPIIETLDPTTLITEEPRLRYVNGVCV